MTQHDLYGYDKVENSNETETDTTSQKDFHDLVSDEREFSKEQSLKTRHKFNQNHNHVTEMDTNEETSESGIESKEKDDIKLTMKDANKCDEKNESLGDTDASQEYPSNPPDHKSVLEEASLLLNSPSIFQPNQMSLQTFQNAIAQFTASAIANNMDNETILKNLAILQSALFTLQHQQFLQFQLIQHLQSQLVNRKPGSEKDLEVTNNPIEHLNDEDMTECQEQEELVDKKEEKIFNLFSKDFVDEDHNNILADKEDEIQKKRLKQKFNDFSDKEISKNDEPSNNFLNDFSLASTIITDHDMVNQVNEPTNSLAMLEKKAQEVLNSASQGILSNNLLDELAFSSDKQSPNGRSDSSLFKHRCRYCGKIFGSDSSLQIHIRSHTGERPYKCNVCGSRFTTKGNLKVHFQRHSEKYPHISMNPNPVPEHLDKYFPPLVPSEALKEMPNAPPSSNSSPFPTTVGSVTGSDNNRTFNQRGFFPDFYLTRQPFDLFGNMLENGARSPVDLSQVNKKSHSPDFRLSPEVMIHESENETKQKIKQEPDDETQYLTVKSKKLEEDHINLANINLSSKCENVEISDSTLQVNQNRSGIIDKEREKDERDFQIRMKNIESITKIPSVSPPSSSSSTSGSLYQDTVLDPSFFSAHLPRPDSNDSSWENFIEISSETSKLQELVDNIDNKNIEPNQCLVCKKVLSCRSALQMHYRVHTGERPFRCKICGRSFTTKGNLKTHMSVHRIKPPMRTLHQCPVCHQKFSNIFVLQQHIRLHTGEINEIQTQEQTRNEPHDFIGLSGNLENKTSPFVSRASEMQAQKRLHEASDDENEDNKNEFHSKQIHPDDNEEPFSEKESKLSKNGGINNIQQLRKRSPSLDQVENNVEDLRTNNLQKLSVNSLTNDELSRSSSPRSSISLKEPKRLRSSSPPSNHRLSSVLTPPSNERINFPYAPQFLGIPQFSPFLNRAPFLTNASMISTANMPPFGLFGVRGNTTTCNICFKTFACNSALEIHYRSHTKERPYKCSICERGFSTKGNMKQHFLTHSQRGSAEGSNDQDAFRKDMNGGSNSEDGFKMKFVTESVERQPHNSSNDVQSEESNSIDFNDSKTHKNEEEKKAKFEGVDDVDDEKRIKEKISEDSEYSLKFSGNGELEKWSKKFNNMPENVVAS